MNKTIRSLFFGCSLLLIAEALQVRAGVAYSDPPGGWTYIYNGDQLIVADDASGFASLDGTWSHNNGSDQWDGSTIGGMFSTGSGFGVDNGPGGANLITENGVSYLRMQDTGDPRDYGYTPDPSNRKIYFGHDVEADGGGADVIDTGVTLTFRARIPTPSNTTFPLDPLHRDGQQVAGVQPYPPEGDGYVTSDGGKGNFVVSQRLGGAIPTNGAIAFSLTQTNDTTGGDPAGVRANFSGLTMNEFNGNQVSANVNFGQGSGTNVIAFDPTQWHEFWIVLRKDPANIGTHQGFIYRDGSLTPDVFRITAGNGNDFTQSYIAFGGTATPQNWALDVDFFGYKLGAEFPPGALDKLPPDIGNVSPGQNVTFYPSSNGVSFTATTLTTNSLPPEGFKLTLNGLDVSNGLKISGTAQNRSVTYTNLAANTIYSGQLVVSDQAGRSSTNKFSFDTFVESSGVLLEAEDFNYSSGQFTDNPPPAGYLELAGTPDVDYFDTTDTSFGNYRSSDTVDTQTTTDTLRLKYSAAGASDYQVGLIQTNEWLNYTRTYTTGTYRVFLRGSATAQQALRLDLVTGDRTLPNQTTTPLGTFPVTSTASLNAYGYAELSDASGNSQPISLSGVQTLRLTALSANNDIQINFLFFAPFIGGPKLTVQKSAANIVVSWNPPGGALEVSSDLAMWSTVDGASNPATIPIGTTDNKFYRVRQ